MKEKYLDYNRQLEAWTKTEERVYFVDVWAPLVDAQGEVWKDIFIADGLHLNEKGYKIWADAIQKIPLRCISIRILYKLVHVSKTFRAPFVVYISPNRAGDGAG